MNNVSDASAEIMKVYALKLIEQIMSQENYVFNTANAVALYVIVILLYQNMTLT